jgi:hypothetical protein
MGREGDGDVLTALLAKMFGKQGAETAKEGFNDLAGLATRAWNERSVRRRGRIEARLRHVDASDDEALDIRIVDISASGVRLRLPRATEFDVMQADRQYLNITVESEQEDQVLGLFISFVRVANMQDDYAELAFRFTYPSEETDRKLDRIHAHYFAS